MIEWIIWIGLALITSEIIFLWHGDDDEWIPRKLISLLVGMMVSTVLFGAPYLFAYGCNYDFILSEYEFASNCVNHGSQVFFWYYGIIIGVVLFFWVNKKLLDLRCKFEDNKKNEYA